MFDDGIKIAAESSPKCNSCNKTFKKYEVESIYLGDRYITLCYDCKKKMYEGESC